MSRVELIEEQVKSLTPDELTAFRDWFSIFDANLWGSRADELEEIAEHCANLPVLDPRDSVEILGYDDIGIPR